MDLLNSIIHALECSYQGTQDQILQAHEFLSNMFNQPSEYSQNFINIIANESISEQIRIAAAIQFKRLLLNSEIINNFSIDNIIEIIIKASNFLVQIQLLSILNRLVNNILLQDPKGGIQFLLNLISICFSSDLNHLLIGIQLIRFIFKSNTRVFPGIGDKNILASKYIIIHFDSLINAGILTFNPFLIHYILITANYIQNFSDFQSLPQWIDLLIQILNQEVDFSSICNFNINKDCVKFATTIIEVKPKMLEPKFFVMLFSSIYNRIKRNKMSYKGILYSLRYVRQFLNLYDMFSDFQESNLILNFVFEILFNFFDLNDNYIQQMNEVLFNFLLYRHNNDEEEMFETPIVGSVCILNAIFEKHIFIEEIVNFSLFQINQNIENGYKIYGAIHFASILAPHLDASYSENIIVLLKTSIEQNNKNPYKIVSFFLFLSNISINNLYIFVLCINILIDAGLPDIIHYFCVISIPNFFKFFSIDDIFENAQLNSNIPIIIKRTLELNSKYPTVIMSKSVKSILEYFLPLLEPVSIEIIQELFSIYHQFCFEDNDNKEDIISSIEKLSSIMQWKDKSIEFYSFAIGCNMKLIMELGSEYYYELLDLLKKIICDSVYLSNYLNTLLLQIPEFLFVLIENSTDYSFFPFACEILKKLALAFSGEPNIHMFVAKILENCLNKYACNSSDNYEVSYLVSSINKLAQILFIVLKNTEVLPNFLDIFTKINKYDLADSFAAMAALQPLLTFSNDLNFKICLNHASPAAFLLSFQFIVSHMNEMPQFIIDSQQLIHETIRKSLMCLKNEEEEDFPSDDSQDDPDIFDFQSLYSFYQS